jgi:hypothetical protein
MLAKAVGDRREVGAAVYEPSLVLGRQHRSMRKLHGTRVKPPFM